MTTKTDAQRDAEVAEETAVTEGAEAAAEQTETAEQTEKAEKTGKADTAEPVDRAEAEAAAGDADGAAADADDDAAEAAAEAELAALAEAEAQSGPSGVGQGAGAIVSVALGIVALSGSWLGTIASARESLIGQLNTSQSASVAQQVSEVYGDSWHAAAVVGGTISLIALLVGAFVLVKPAFGVPGKPQALWIRSTAWAGVSLAVLGLLLAVAKYSDILLGLPKTS
ncbi:hypothetical protein [Streptomyces longispororuber]|uniref:hypothetical protein n=1 Tax=Streptomyces longispororuber TaxID=68230 RepID=UPI00210B1233|nr:hypothetical protein [Streptomyces longispororuber]MCQ4206706.1 hypothetical protein [Streptomyces longispororuber]